MRLEEHPVPVLRVSDPDTVFESAYFTLKSGHEIVQTFATFIPVNIKDIRLLY